MTLIGKEFYREKENAFVGKLASHASERRFAYHSSRRKRDVELLTVRLWKADKWNYAGSAFLRAALDRFLRMSAASTPGF